MSFKPKVDKILDSILYLARKGVDLDQYKLVKLLYLADREHFRRFGRPITFDRYVAMEFGPVASIAYDLVRRKQVLGVRLEDLPFEIHKHGTLYLVGKPKRDVRRDIFSRSDLLVLDEIVQKYSKASFDELYEITHDHFAYDRAWQNRNSNADQMRFEDFLDEEAAKEAKVSDLEFTAKGM